MVIGETLGTFTSGVRYIRLVLHGFEDSQRLQLDGKDLSLIATVLCMVPTVLKNSYMIKLRDIRDVNPQEIQLLANNYAIAKNLRDVFPHPYTLADAHFFLELCTNGALGKVFALYAEDKFVGVGSLIPQTGQHRMNAEIGYWLGEAYWGKGYATEAVRLLVEFAFNQLALLRVYAYIFSYNVASMRVLEKCGFQAEAILKDSIIKEDTLYDEHIYSVRKL